MSTRIAHMIYELMARVNPKSQKLFGTGMMMAFPESYFEEMDPSEKVLEQIFRDLREEMGEYSSLYDALKGSIKLEGDPLSITLYHGEEVVAEFERRE